MAGYTKLFGSILKSTIWQESKEVRLVWVTMLAMADRGGVVDSSVPGLAKDAGVSIEECEVALRKFLEPDAYSRTKDFDGRRIEVVDGGWKLLNYEKYRRKLGVEENREKAAIRQQNWRDRKKRKVDSEEQRYVKLYGDGAPDSVLDKITDPKEKPLAEHVDSRLVEKVEF